MRGAGAADALHLLAQFPTSAQQAHIERVHTLATGICDFGNRTAFEIDATEQFCIRFGQLGQQFHHTLAERRLVLRRERIRQLMCELFQSRITRGATPMRVDDGVTQDPVKPGDHALGICWHLISLERLNQTLLHQIGRQIRIARARAGKAEKGVEMLKEGVGGHA